MRNGAMFAMRFGFLQKLLGVLVADRVMYGFVRLQKFLKKNYLDLKGKGRDVF
jgi:hypothetical protein